MKRIFCKTFKVISVFLMPVKYNLSFFIFIYVLGLITIFIEVQTFHFKIPRFNFLSLILDIYILCLLLMVIPRRLRPFARTIVSGIAYILAIINAFSVEHFYARIGPEILNVLLETNLRESSEFVNKYINLDVMWSGVGAIILLMILHYFTFKYLNLNKFVFPHTFSILIKLCSSFLICASIVFCCHSRIKIVKLMLVSTSEEVDVLISNHSQNTPFNNLLFSIKMREIANNGLTVLAKTQDYVTIDSCSYDTDNIILIIGESYIKDHAQLYGYGKETTPRQVTRTELSEKGHLLSFNDVISPSNLTSTVFKNVFSLHSMDEKTDWAYYPLFPVLFRKADYKVFFITNQFVQALGTDIFNLSGGLFLNHNRLNVAQFDFRNTQTHRYDMDLLEDYDSLKQYRADHNLIIFHLAGQHIDFGKRSPEEYKIFTLSDYQDRKDLNESEKQLVADYDNATYYNDIVVDSIVRLFENENAVVIYMPDHGEECFDETHRMGRLPSDNYAPETLRQEYRIPFWVWCSKLYIETHPTLYTQIEESRLKPFMTDDLPHLLLYLAGISCKYYSEKRNLVSPFFDVKRKRMINGKCDYDKVINQRMSQLSR